MMCWNVGASKGDGLVIHTKPKSAIYLHPYVNLLFAEDTPRPQKMCKGTKPGSDPEATAETLLAV